jgi:hypothetical protein
MTPHLVVTKPFLKYVRGDIIANPATINMILSTEHRTFVAKVAVSTTSKG